MTAPAVPPAPKKKITCPGCQAEIDVETGEAEFRNDPANPPKDSPAGETIEALRVRLDKIEGELQAIAEGKRGDPAPTRRAAREISNRFFRR